jgi:1-acyl-sn-glycerol-3-phosphate acyltransferase
MKFLFRFFQLIYCLYAFVIFFITLVVVFPLALIASVFGTITGGNFLLWVCKCWGKLWYFLIGIRHKNVYEVPHDFKKQYIFVANHISYLDGPCIVHTMKQHFRPLGKVEMIHVPLFGLVYKIVVVTVDRSSPENRAKSVRRLKAVLRKGISIFIFPEGTFNMTGAALKDFYDGAFRLAIETQTPVKPILFLDTYKLMHHRHITTLQPGIERSVYLGEIPVDGLTMKDVPLLKQKVFDIMDQKLRQYKADWVKGSQSE